MLHRRTLLLATLAASCASDPRGVRQEPVAFEVNGATMRGALYLPEQARPAPLLIAYHAASGGSAAFPFYNHLKHDLPAQGIATFVFDRRGTNGQPGDFTSATFEDLARDGIGALQVIKANPAIDARRIGAWGISQGGWIAPLATTISADYAFAISVSGPGVTPARQMDYSAEYNLRERGFAEDVVARALALRARINTYFRTAVGREALQRDIDGAHAESWFDAAYLPLSASGQLPADPARTKWRQEMDFDPNTPLRRLDKPLLAMFGAKDRWVPVDESIAAMRANAPGTLLQTWVSPTSGHLMSGHAESAEYGGEDGVEPAYVNAMLRFIENAPRNPHAS